MDARPVHTGVRPYSNRARSRTQLRKERCRSASRIFVNSEFRRVMSRLGLAASAPQLSMSARNIAVMRAERTPCPITSQIKTPVAEFGEPDCGKSRRRQGSPRHTGGQSAVRIDCPPACSGNAAPSLGIIACCSSIAIRKSDSICSFFSRISRSFFSSWLMLARSNAFWTLNKASVEISQAAFRLRQRAAHRRKCFRDYGRRPSAAHQ